MDVLPLPDAGLGSSAHLVDLGDGGAIVIDPLRDPAPYLAGAERRGLRIRFAAETHLHADFVSGGRELAAEGASLLAPVGSDLRFDHRGLEDGEEIDLGGYTLRAIATPGHTPEHLAYLLLDGSTPVALFSGGTLIAGGVARTDLLAPERTEPLARDAYRSIHERLLALPDDLPVYPTHGGGSFCSTSAGEERTTTIGRERRTNPLLRAAEPDEFVERLLAGFGSYPSYFLRLRDVNRDGPPVHGPRPPRLPALTPRAVAAEVEDGAEVVDVRPIARYARSHLPGSVSIELRETFATWLGWLVDPDRPLVFVVDEDQDTGELVRQCLLIGHERLAGYVDGGVAAWEGSGRPLTSTPLLDGPETTDRALIDVRQRTEWEAGHAPGALHVELGTLASAADGLPERPLVHCGHGQRAMTGASLLERAGVPDVAATTADHAALATARGGRVVAE